MISMNQSRLKRVINNMQSEHLSQILVTSTASVYYLTGLWVEPLERMLALYINIDGTCILFGNDLFGITQTDGMKFINHNDAEDPIEKIAYSVKPGTLGIDKFWPSRFLIRLLQLRPDIQPLNGSAPVDDARKIKDAQEIEALRTSSAVNDKVMAQAVKALKSGASEAELAAYVETLFRKNGADHSGEGQLVCFGPSGAEPHHAPQDLIIKEGQSCIFDIFIPIHRYWCDMTRTVFFRSVSKKQREVYETVKKANLSAENMIRPGIPMCEIDKTARAVIEEAGYGKYFTHRLGHGLGIECHEPPDNSSSNTVLTQPGMVFSVEPGIYLPQEFGVRIEDLVLVTENGCEVLNHYTKDLQIVE